MHVVVLRALGLGDFLTGVPAFRAIRRAFPHARITLAAPKIFAPLAALIDDGGAIDDFADTHELAPLPESACDADLGIDLHGKGPASRRLLRDARARRIVGFRHPQIPDSFDSPVFDPDEHEVARWCRLLRESGISALADAGADADALALRVPALAPALRDVVCGATLLHPGAASESRRWPIERWSEIARAERRRGREVAITGGPTEISRALAIARAAAVPRSHLFAGTTTLEALAALVAHAGRVVCGDTGVAHLASAFSRPSVVLFGPTPPAHWGPPARPYHRVLWRGSIGDPHGERVDAGLAALGVDDVLAEIDALDALERPVPLTA